MKIIINYATPAVKTRQVAFLWIFMACCFFSSAYAQQDNLTVNWGDGTAFTNIDNLTPTANAANWDLSGGTHQIQIVASFANVATAGTRTIIVRIPRGFKIQAYSAKSGTTAITGVSQIGLSTEAEAKVSSSTLTALDGTAWLAQQITGYTAMGSTGANTPYRNMDGMVTYQLNQQCDNITLTLTLALDPYLFPYNATSVTLPDINVEMVNTTSSADLKNSLTITATGLVAPTLGSPTSTFPNTGNTRPVAGVVNSSDATGNTGTVPAFATGITYFHYSTASGAMTHYADVVTFTTTYPAGVTYQGFDMGQLNSGARWLSLPYTAAPAGGSFAGGHLTVTVNTTNRTVTYTLTDILTTHNNAQISLIRSYWTADVDNSTITWNKVLPFITTMTDTSGSLIGNSQTSSPSSNTVNITVVKPAVKILLTPQNRTIRDLNAYANTAAGVDFPYDQALGTFAINNSGPSKPENITYTFTFPASPEVRGVSLPAVQASDAAITATGITNTGRTVNYSGSPTIETLSFIQLTPQILGLATDEYLTSLTIEQQTLDLLNFNPNYTNSAIVYHGKWNNGREGDVNLTITDSGGNILATATDHTTIGWTISGTGTMTTTVQTPTGNPANTFYPGQTINFTSSYISGGMINNNNNPNLVDPDIYICLPAGIDLDPTSLTTQSVAGNNGSTRFALQSAGSSSVVIGGTTWTIYLFRVVNPLDIIALSSNQSNYVSGGNGFNILFSAIVSSACTAYPALSAAQICELDLGQTGISATANLDYTVSDTYNIAGKGTGYKLAGATQSPNLSVVQKPGLQVYLGIKTTGSSADYNIYNGLTSSIAMISKDLTAEVWMKYENTSTQPYLVGSEIYMPVPKKTIAYDHYFYNADFSNPGALEDGKTANQPPQFSLELTSEVDLFDFDTYYGVNTSPTTNYMATGITETWTPVSMDWFTYSELTAAGYTLADVTMLKFVANQNIGAAGSSTSTGETIFHLAVGSDAQIGQINYWRSYEKGWTSSTGTGTWVYGSVLAAEPAMSGVRGMFFNDANLNGVLDAGENYTTASPVPAGFTATLSGPGITGSMNMVINPDGSFQSMDPEGGIYYLGAGVFTVTFTNDNPSKYHFTTALPANRSYFDAGNNPVWYNDIPVYLIRTDNTQATFNFTVSSLSTATQLIGVGLKAVPTFIPVNPQVRKGLP